MTSTHSSRTSRRDHYPALLVSTLVLAAACSTQEIESPPVFELADSASEGRTAPFILVVAPDPDTLGKFGVFNAGSPEYALHIDGQPVARADGATWIPIDHIRAQRGPGGFVPAGAHTIQLVDQDGNTALETPALDLQPNRTNILVAFGRRAALEHRFVATGFDVPAGMYRIAVLNLIATGQAVELVECSGDAAVTCATILAGPVTYGETFLVDFPLPATVPCNESVGPGITCAVGPWTSLRPVAPAGAVPSIQAPFPVRSLDFGGMIDHPSAARIQLAAPVLIDLENGFSVGI